MLGSIGTVHDCGWLVIYLLRSSDPLAPVTISFTTNGSSGLSTTTILLSVKSKTTGLSKVAFDTSS
jgi:hypothetical protein